MAKVPSPEGGYTWKVTRAEKILGAITLGCDSDDPRVAYVAACIAVAVMAAILYGLYSLDWLILPAPARSWQAFLGLLQYISTFVTGLAVGLGWTMLHDL